MPKERGNIRYMNEIESIIPKKELDAVYETLLQFHSTPDTELEEFIQLANVTEGSQLKFDVPNNIYNAREFQNICGEPSPCLEFTELLGISNTLDVCQKNVIGLKQKLRSTLVNLMGNEWVNETMYLPKAMTNTDERIQFSIIKEWCDMVSKGSVDRFFPSYSSLAAAISYNTDNMENGIANGTYEDMCVNSVTCYTIVALIREMANKTGDIVFKILEDIDMSIYGFFTNCGCRNITLACCYAAVCIFRAIKDVELTGKLSEYVIGAMNNKVLPLLQSTELLGKNPNFIEKKGDVSEYADMLSHFLDNLERKYGFGITAEDVSDFRIPYSVSMGKPRVHNTQDELNWSLFSEYNDISRDNMHINQMKRELNMICNDSDSSVAELRVESFDLQDTYSPIAVNLVRMCDALENHLIGAIYDNSVENVYKWITCEAVLIAEIDGFKSYYAETITESDRQLLSTLEDTMSYKIDKYSSVLGVEPKSVTQYASAYKHNIERILNCV